MIQDRRRSAVRSAFAKRGSAMAPTLKRDQRETCVESTLKMRPGAITILRGSSSFAKASESSTPGSAAQAAGVFFHRLGGLLREHEIAGAAPRLDQPARHQQLEGRHHGVLGIAVQLGQFAQRRQLVAGLVGAAGNLAFEGAGERVCNGRHGAGL